MLTFRHCFNRFCGLKCPIFISLLYFFYFFYGSLKSFQHIVLLLCASVHALQEALYKHTAIASWIVRIPSAYVGEWQLPLDSDERYVSGFVQMSSDSRVIVGAESSTVLLMYICQFPSTMQLLTRHEMFAVILFFDFAVFDCNDAVN